MCLIHMYMLVDSHHPLLLRSQHCLIIVIVVLCVDSVALACEC